MLTIREKAQFLTDVFNEFVEDPIYTKVTARHSKAGVVVTWYYSKLFKPEGMRDERHSTLIRYPNKNKKNKNDNNS